MSCTTRLVLRFPTCLRSRRGGTALSVIDHEAYGETAVVGTSYEAADLADAALVDQAQAGSAEAFATLYDRHQVRLKRYCRCRLNNAEDADDAAQEAFLRAWRAIDSFGGDRHFYAWLRTIAGNVCTDAQRRGGRTIPVAEFDSLPPAIADGNAEDVLVARSDTDLVSEAMSRLTDRHREILQMREFTGWTYEHIADHERLELSAVKSLVWRARQALRREFLLLSDGVPALLVSAVGLVAWFGRRLSAAGRSGVRLAEAAGQFSAGAGAAVGTAVTATAVATAVTVATVVPPPPAPAAPTPAPVAVVSAPARTSAPRSRPAPVSKTVAQVAVAEVAVAMASLLPDVATEPSTASETDTAESSSASTTGDAPQPTAESGPAAAPPETTPSPAAPGEQPPAPAVVVAAPAAAPAPSTTPSAPGRTAASEKATSGKATSGKSPSRQGKDAPARTAPLTTTTAPPAPTTATPSAPTGTSDTNGQPGRGKSSAEPTKAREKERERDNDVSPSSPTAGQPAASDKSEKSSAKDVGVGRTEARSVPADDESAVAIDEGAKVKADNDWSKPRADSDWSKPRGNDDGPKAKTRDDAPEPATSSPVQSTGGKGNGNGRGHGKER